MSASQRHAIGTGSSGRLASTVPLGTLHEALGGMRAIPQWFLWKLVWDEAKGKYAKTPCPLNGAEARIDASVPQNWNTYEVARSALREGFALGFWMTEECGYWLLDIDGCVDDQGVMTDVAAGMCKAFEGALFEFSSSRKGVHLIGRCSGPMPEHSCRHNPLEFYTAERGIAFGLDGEASGSADSLHDANVAALVAQWFPPRAEMTAGGTERRSQWRGPEDDDELIRRMLASKPSAASVFGGKASVQQLWAGQVEKNSEHDMALCAHLAFWTGCDGERMERLLWKSGMVREKWRDHRTYLSMTIAAACLTTENVYKERQIDEEGAAHQCTELANAYRYQKLHGTSAMAVAGIGWFMREPNGPWRHDVVAAHRHALALGKAILTEADQLSGWVKDAPEGSEERAKRAAIEEQRKKWARTSESSAVIGNTLKLAANLLAVSADKLDASPLLVGCPGGVLDLTDMTTREYRYEDYITKTIAVDYDPHAKAPVWDRFVHQITGGDEQLVDYLQRLCGYILSGTRSEHILPILYGTGANGKSTFLSILQTLMNQYAGVAAPGLLIARAGNEHPTGLAALQGRRLVVVSETGESGHMNEEQVKALTGGDRIAARRMRQDFYEFDPTHVIVLQTNHKPRISGTDEGIWRRVKLIPFTVTIPPENRDTGLGAKLLSELPGILTWVLDGWRNYRLRGLLEPDAVREITANYRAGSDHVGTFLSEMCVMGAGLSVPSTQLYCAYRRWCEEAGERPLSQRMLGLRLAERPGVASTRTSSARIWTGLALSWGVSK